MLQSLRKKVAVPDRAQEISGAADTANGLDAVGLLEAIVCETHTAALHTMVIAGSMNAFRTRDLVKAPATLRNFLPEKSAMIDGLLRSHEEAGLKVNVVKALRDFFAEVSALRGEAERFLADAGKPGADPSTNSVYAAIRADWVRLSEHAIDTLVLLDTAMKGRVPNYYAENSATLLKLLKQTAGGHHPCFDDSGHISLPDLPQRRRAARRSLLQQCTLRYRGKSAPVIAKDISATGLGLERIPDLKASEVVQIELTGGRKLMGLVMWVRGTSAGIRLGRALLPNDPLLIG